MTGKCKISLFIDTYFFNLHYNVIKDVLQVFLWPVLMTKGKIKQALIGGRFSVIAAGAGREVACRAGVFFWASDE